MAKSKKNQRQEILNSYMEYCLKNGSSPVNMYQFALDLNMKEEKIYAFFSSFDAMEKATFEWIFDYSIELLSKDPAFEEHDAQNKLISFYYTFFEILKVNRTYVLFSLERKGGIMHAMRVLSGLKKKFIDMIESLEIETMDLKQERLEKYKKKGFNELAWNQFLGTLQFWMKDDSPDFEKTDIFIEKSLKASFDLVDIRPVQSLIDFGKFLFKEKMSM